MATYKNGILGSFSGKIGSVVFTTWKGIPVIRSKPIRKKINPSPLQEQQRAKFKLISGFLKPLKDLLNQTFHQSAMGMSWFNKALSENKSAIIGNYPLTAIDYPKILLSKGKLPLGEPPTISSQESGKLLLTWKKGDGIDRDLTEGSAFIAAYQEELNRWIIGQYDISSGITTCVLDVEPFVDKGVQTYIGFISKNSSKKSESRYMGVVNVRRE
jgi:Family of unknown function (DUF6266)